MLTNRANLVVGAVLCLFLVTACSGGGGGGNGVVPVSGTPNMTVSQSTIDFSGVVQSNSADRSVEIKNTGNGDLKIGTIQQPNLPFTVSNDTCSNKTLKPAQKCSVNVHFSPSSQGLYADTFSIPSNDPDSSAANISLKGEGYGLNAWINQVTIGACPNPEISLDVTVTDPKGILDLTTLTRSNFSLSENSIPIDPLAFMVGNIQISPVSVVLTLDSSSSESNVVTELKAAAKYFIDLLKDTDEAAICKFSNVIEFYPISSPYFLSGDVSGKTDLKTYVDSLYNAVSGTRFYDAVYQSVDRAAEGSKAKRAVIVLSDGIEASGINPSIIATLDQVIAHAKEKGIIVFTILHYDPNFHGGQYAQPEALQRLAQETGGQYYNSVNTDLSEVFRQISSVLSNKYTLTYTSSSACTGALSLGVRVDYDGLYGIDTRNVSLP